jgi:hypothetical protein
MIPQDPTLRLIVTKNDDEPIYFTYLAAAAIGEDRTRPL